EVVRDRVAELLAPELDVEAVRAQSVVKMDLGRVVGSILLGDGTIFLVLLIIGIVTTVIATGSPLFLVGVIPALIGVAGYYVKRFGRSLRFTIASTPDGVRIGYGLLSTTNETLP